MIQRKVCCEECLESLIDANNPLTDQWFQLLKQKKWGSLVVASTDVIKVCLETELLLSKLLIQIGDNLPKESFLALKVSTAVLKKLFQSWMAFKSLSSHMKDLSPDQNHVFELVKLISASYLKICLHHLAKEKTLSITNSFVWQLTQIKQHNFVQESLVWCWLMFVNAN